MRVRYEMTRAGSLACGLIAIVVSSAPGVAKDRPAFTSDRLGPFQTSDYPTPSDVRVENGELLAVLAAPGRSTPLVMQLEARPGAKPSLIDVRPLPETTRLNIRSIARLDRDSFVASAAWTEGNTSRSGFLFLDSEGKAVRKIGYGISLRSFAVLPQGLLAASIQEPSPFESPEADSPSPFTAAVFEMNGEMVNRIMAGGSGVDKKQSEQLRRHGMRKVYPAPEGFWVSFPYARQMSLQNLRTENGRMARNPTSGKVEQGKVMRGAWTRYLDTPAQLEGDHGAYARTILPRRDGGFLALWEYGRPRSAPSTSYGSFALVTYDEAGKAARFEEVPGVAIQLIYDGEEGRLLQVDPTGQSWSIVSLGIE
jgi:hypothetical protein